MKIVIMVEGRTETAFKQILIAFLKPILGDKMPKLDFQPYDGRIPTDGKLKRIVSNLINDKNSPADAVIALTDVYTGTNPPIFRDAADAKKKMQQWVGIEPKFYPHAAMHDFEAWLLPFWGRIKSLSRTNHKSPGPNPEAINHGNPPAHRLKAEFESGQGKSYVKSRDCIRILQGADLMIAINACPELKSFVNTIISLCDKSKVIP